MTQVMKAIVGLGNPGPDYARTRHNLGFLVVDALAEGARISLDRIECDAFVGRGGVADVAVLLAKPRTFMNRSGDAVACLVSTYALEPADVLVVVDDLALPLGTIRLRRRGRSGGHNGLKSIIEALGTTDFPRLRLGIKPECPIEDTVAFVLSEFEEHEWPLVEAMIARAIEAITVFLREGIDAAMSRFNSRAPEMMVGQR
ncbi:MAG TPA: aminoacyl-tRNA hydrolase [Blastocatellia bacterium]|nr:aminoacyl-tRNA hydrolase [Blastocatellia bacterium]